MSRWGALAGSNTTMVVSAVTFAVAAVGAGFYINNRIALEPDTVILVPEKSSETLSKTDASVAISPVEDAADNPPSIDEVRVEADGLTIVAGRASPGSKVSVLLDGVENTSVTTDAGGGFAAITAIQPKTTAQVLTIVQRLGDKALPSLDEIILAPSSGSALVAQVDPETDTEVGTRPATSVAVALPDTPDVVAGASPGVESVSEPDVVEAAPAARAQGEAVADVGPSTGQDTTTEAGAAPAAGQDIASATDPAKTTDGSIRPSGDADQIAQSSNDIASDTQSSSAPQAAGAQVPVATADASGASEATPNADRSTDSVVSATAEASTKPQTSAVQPTSEPVTELANAATTTLVPEQTVTILKSTPDGVEVLGPRLGASDAIAIDTISYSEKGDVQLTGRAQSEADVVRVYINNRSVTELTVDAQGRWRGGLPGVDAGVYTLRVDEVDAAGDVISRVETPFKREDPQLLALANSSLASAKKITVQTGATLWAIARDRYGEGLLYVQVFEANRDAIRDPDLIYPGQVFALPD